MYGFFRWLWRQASKALSLGQGLSMARSRHSVGELAIVVSIGVIIRMKDNPRVGSLRLKTGEKLLRERGDEGYVRGCAVKLQLSKAPRL
ncbi:hypothetical protein M3J09_010198 [Ascochyta lentis]